MLTALALASLVIAPGFQRTQDLAANGEVTAGRMQGGNVAMNDSAPLLGVAPSEANYNATEPKAPEHSEQRPRADAPKADAPERSARLLAERAELQSLRPRIVAPLLLTFGGLVAGLSGLAFMYVGLFTAIYYAFSFAVGSVVLLSIGIVLFAAGIPLTAIGAVRLHRARKERQRIDQRLEQLDAEEEAGMQTLLTF